MGLRIIEPGRLGRGLFSGAPPPLPPTTLIVFDNSWGTSDHFEWPAKLATKLASDGRTNITVINRSVGGAEIESHYVACTAGGGADVGDVSGLIGNFASWILPYKSATPGVRNILLLCEMNNRLLYNFSDGAGHAWGHSFTNGASVYTASNGVADAIALAASNGIETMVVTPMNWADPDYDRTALETAFGQLSTACLANTGGASAVLDLRGTASPPFEPYSDANGDFDGGGIHPSNSGAQRKANIVAARSVGLI